MLSIHCLSLPGLFQRRFYNRLMLYNMVIFMAVAYLFAFIATDYSNRLDRMKKQQQNRDALNAICGYYDRKHDEFLNLIFPLYEETKNYSVITRLLESESDQEYINDPYVKQEIVNVLRGITVRDRDIAAVLIYKKLTGVRYVYSSNSRTLESVGLEYPFFSKLKRKTAGRSIYGTETIGNGTSAIKVHGIAGTLGTRNIRQEAGSFAVVYETRAIERVLQAYTGKTQGWFMLVTTDGDIIFDSRGKYDKERVPYIETLTSGKESASIDGEPCYIQIIPIINRQYIGVHIVPKKEIDVNRSGFPAFIFSIFSGLVLVSCVLYFASGSIISRRVGELVKGMKRIGSHNLSYRIPLHGRKDEFEEIAIRFNEMCDELQETINREYVNEIKKKNAELNALQAGINPHFLYNTLEAIRTKAIDDGNGDVAEMIVLLANLFRSIVRDNTFITVHKEINTCSMYLNIFSLRYASSLTYEINIEPRVLEYGIPKNLLQPIVENYFLHGIRNDWEDNQFVMKGWLEGSDIVFSFEDNGRGIDKNRLKDIQNRILTLEMNKESSYGLANVHERIRLVYGEPYGLWIDSNENSYTKVLVRIKALTCDELKNSISDTSCFEGEN